MDKRPAEIEVVRARRGTADGTHGTTDHRSGTWANASHGADRGTRTSADQPAGNRAVTLIVAARR